MNPLPPHVVFFDGVCGFCQQTVQWLLRLDRTRILRYASLQGSTAAALRQRHFQALSGVDSFLYVTRSQGGSERLFIKSEAVLQLLRDLGGLWRIASWFRFIPVSWRDRLYDAFARRRYAWFGRLEACPRPSPETQWLFLP